MTDAPPRLRAVPVGDLARNADDAERRELHRLRRAQDHEHGLHVREPVPSECPASQIENLRIPGLFHKIAAELPNLT